MPRSRIEKRLQAVLDRLVPRVRRQVLKALQQLASSVSVEVVITALERRDFWSLERLVAGLPRDLAKPGRELTAAFKAGFDAAMLEARPGLTVSVTNAVAARSAEASAARLVTGVTGETRRAIRRLVVDAFVEGVPVRTLAQKIRPLVGLTDRQARAVLNKRTALEAAGKTAKQVDAISARYAETLRRQRAVMIARTEVIRASTDGKIAAWKALQAKGQLSPRLRKTWIVTPDDRLCPICEPLDGEQVVIDGQFRTRVGLVMGPPAHPQCRCAIGLTDVKAAVVRRVA